jgi:hypothetical protein
MFSHAFVATAAAATAAAATAAIVVAAAIMQSCTRISNSVDQQLAVDLIAFLVKYITSSKAITARRK